MTRVEPGQVWRIADMIAGRVDVTITKIEGSTVTGVAPSGREYTIPLKTLKRGLRGSALARHADGTEVDPKRPRAYRGLSTEKRTASELLKTERPRGVKAVSENHRAIATARAAGASVAEVAGRFGIAPGTVSRICQDVAEADTDARVLERMKRGAA